VPVAKYDPLFRHLCRAGDDPVEMSFDDIERLVGPLPAAASRTRAWWTSDPRAGTHPQAKAWADAGRDVESVDVVARRVRFGRAGWTRGS